jgi:hypothetical protein
MDESQSLDLAQQNQYEPNQNNQAKTTALVVAPSRGCAAMLAPRPTTK